MNDKNFKEKMVFLNTFMGYVLLLVGLGCYLSIALVEENFQPSRFSLAVNLCSGVVMVAVNQISASSNLSRSEENSNVLDSRKRKKFKKS